MHAPVAQWIAHRTSNPRVVGSSPTGGAFEGQGLLDASQHQAGRPYTSRGVVMTAQTRRAATPIDWLFAPEWLDLETACFLSGWTQGQMLRIIEEQSLEEFNETLVELLHWDD